MANKRKLIEPDIDEVSLVAKGANLKKFFFVKNLEEDKEMDINVIALEKGNTSIQVNSDGTVNGTVVKINGSEIENISDFYFSFYKMFDEKNLPIDAPEEAPESKVNCRFTQASKGKVAGSFRVNHTYILSKQLDKIALIRDEDKKIVEGFLGSEVVMSEEDGVEVAKNLSTITDYKEVFPQVVNDALQNIISVFVKKDNPLAKDKVKENIVSDTKVDMKELAGQLSEAIINTLVESGIVKNEPVKEETPAAQTPEPVIPAQSKKEEVPAEVKPTTAELKAEEPAKVESTPAEEEVEISPEDLAGELVAAVQEGLGVTPSG